MIFLKVLNETVSDDRQAEERLNGQFTPVCKLMAWNRLHQS